MQVMRNKLHDVGSIDDVSQGLEAEDFDSSPEMRNMGDDFLIDGDDGDFNDDDDMIDSAPSEEELDHVEQTQKKVALRTKSIEEVQSKR